MRWHSPGGNDNDDFNFRLAIGLAAHRAAGPASTDSTSRSSMNGSFADGASLTDIRLRRLVLIAGMGKIAQDTVCLCAFVRVSDHTVAPPQRPSATAKSPDGLHP